MRLLDLFCGAGGASAGYARMLPGIEIVGVDWAPQPRCPFTFVQADATTYPVDGFDIVHASPPCQGHSVMRGYERDNRWTLPHTIDRLRDSNVPVWFVENINDVTWPIGASLTLCGSSLGCLIHSQRLFLARHRKFWTNANIQAPECACDWYRANGWVCAGVYGSTGNHTAFKSRRATLHEGNALMGVDWMTRKQLTESVPPAYTAYLAGQLFGP